MEHTAQLMYTKTCTGVPAYQAVELFKDGGKYTTSVDIWSLGCILYEMLHYQEFFSIETQVIHPWALAGMLMNKVLNNEHQPINDSCPVSAKEMILKCVDPEPTKRPTILNLLDNSIDLKMFFDQEANESDQDLR